MDFVKILNKLTLLESKEEEKLETAEKTEVDGEDKDTDKEDKSEKLDEAVVLSADDSDAMAILDMIRLAGIEKGPESAMPVTPSPMATAIDPVTPDHDMGMGMDSGVDIGPEMDSDMSLDSDEELSLEEFEYGNSPDEHISPMSAAIPSGDDLHKRKKAYHPTAGGDNPMSLEARLSEMFEAFKNGK